MKKTIIGLSILSICLITSLLIYNYYNKDHSIINDIPVKDNNMLDDDQIKEDNLKIEEETKVDNEEVINKAVETQKSSNAKKSTTSNNISESNQASTKKDNQTSNNSKVDTATSEIIQPPVQHEEVKEEPKPDQIDTNSFFYSIHHGNIDTSTESGCLDAGFEIAYIDTVDINYYRCYEVTMTSGKIVGYYLNVFCNSDNCNRYKSMIDWSKYD